MFGSMKTGANAYAKVGVETGVLAASPHKLIVMLFDGAIVAELAAIRQMENGDIPGKGKSISKAITIIDSGLRASLDVKAGGEIAANLDALYEYMGHRLLVANLNNQAEILEEVHRLLADLKSAWDAIGLSAKPVEEASAQAPKLMAYDIKSPNATNFMNALP